MTTGVFKYLDPATLSAGSKPWAKVDGPDTSFGLTSTPSSVHDVRAASLTTPFNTDTCGFGLYRSPSAYADTDPLFLSDAGVRSAYYDEVIRLVKQHVGAADVVIFDHTIRRRDPTSPRQPVQQVHVDQTPRAAEARVKRHVPAEEAGRWLQGRYAIINVWRPLVNKVEDFPLAMVDWRSTKADDLVAIDLLYPRTESDVDDGDDRGKERLPDPSNKDRTDGYQVKGETYGVAPGQGHRFYYAKGMGPEEVLFLKCFDSRGERRPGGRKGLADGAPHTAFEDPETREGAPWRQSIEVRCLVKWDE